LIARIPSDVDTVLDLGCGGGGLVIKLAFAGKRVSGTDLCEQALEEARTRAQQSGITSASFVASSAEQLSDRFAAGAFDCVVSLNALHHFLTSEASSEIFRCLRPGGCLIVLDTINDYCLGERSYLATLLLYDLLHPWYVIRLVRRFGFRRVVGFYLQLRHMLRTENWRQHIKGEVLRRNVYSYKRYKRRFEMLFPGGEVRRVFSYSVLATYRKPASDEQ